jgi:hypothetical protein
MGNANHHNSDNFVANGIQDSIVSLPYTILLLTREFLATGRPRIPGQVPDAFDDSKLIF